METIPELHEVEFLNGYEELPATAPVDHARIIHLPTFMPADGEFRSNIKLQDAIVTMLYNISPTTLEAFMNAPTVPGSFRLVQENTDGSSDDKLLLIRKSDYVMVGRFRELSIPAGEVYEFDHLARLSIANDGRWKLLHAVYRTYFRRDWDLVWSGFSVSAGEELDRDTILEPKEEERMAYGVNLAEHMMVNKLWDASHSITIIE
ncbi:hypothetical protein N0V83_000683 [Neocucurbitaria cava]|uniref:Uncharacterized protein n=1 Tax=Neocucurbitaria cava TaxID=798079 RepID=A0A9W8YHY2_9PLEO|nr:hypothetical protein N0V83_000683 [Neocucurbitaria cava]